MSAHAADFPGLLGDMAAHGVFPANPQEIQLDDTHQRFHLVAQYKGSKNGWLRGHVDADGRGALVSYKDWAVGEVHVWRTREQAMRGGELRAAMMRTSAVAAAAKAAEADKYDKIAAAQLDEWRLMDPADASHPYLHSKGVAITGARVDSRGNLALPMYSMAGAFRGTQRIAGMPKAKEKHGNRVLVFPRWFKGALKHSYVPCWPTGAVRCKSIDTLGIAEGAASAQAAANLLRFPVAAALSRVNLLDVAQDARVRWPDARLLILADNDAGVVGNPGLTDAYAAAAAVGAEVCPPPDGFQGDWCDWMQSRGGAR